MSFQKLCPFLSWSFKEETSTEQILIISFKGEYRSGSRGNNDADLMTGIVFTANKLFNPSKIIIDLSELSYSWGNRLLYPLNASNKDSLAIVVGKKSKNGVFSLFGFTQPNERPVNVFDTIEEAIIYLKDTNGLFLFYTSILMM